MDMFLSVIITWTTSAVKTGALRPQQKIIIIIIINVYGSPHCAIS